MKKLKKYFKLISIFTFLLSAHHAKLFASKPKSKKNNFNQVTQQINDLEKKVRKLEQRLELLENAEESKVQVSKT